MIHGSFKYNSTHQNPNYKPNTNDLHLSLFLFQNEIHQGVTINSLIYGNLILFFHMSTWRVTQVKNRAEELTP